ncbi:MAG: glycosyltransferase [Myxococcaceae bacterium]|nr:glycosyltransferase [Myxococcaceae bacterium]
MLVRNDNEAKRLRPGVFEPFIKSSPRFRLLFVDDGSKDDTRPVLKALCASLGERAQVLGLDVNGGKAEAVRAGLKKALHDGAKIVGYYDADGATPAEEMLSLLEVLEASHAKAVLASRVALLGRDIRRRPARHYAGRVFATAASLILRLPVYDTQCGAKLFAHTPALESALEKPFAARWAFDVELLGRLLKGDETRPGLTASDFIEVPLGTWVDVAGSQLGMTTYPQVLAELAGIAWRLR